MSKQLVEEILALEEQYAKQLQKANHDKEAAIHKAHEQAMTLVQDAENSLDTQREAAIREWTERLHKEKEQSVAAAKKDAATLSKSVQPKIPQAAKQMLATFTDYVEHELS